MSDGDGDGGDRDRAHYPAVLQRSRAKAPKTARGERTRAKVVDSAREIFDSDGYAGARIVDIVEHADVALGTFYSYFDDKTDVLATLLEQVFEELYDAARAPYLDSEEPEAVLRASIDAYVRVYHQNHDLMRTLMEAITVDQQFADLWFEIRGHFLRRVVHNIERAQAAGLARPLNPVLEASALGGMLENFCWIWFAMGGERHGGEPLVADLDLDEAVEVLANLWVSALFDGG